MILSIQNLVKFCPSILKILIKNQFLTSFKGRNSCSPWSDLAKIQNSVQTCWLSSLPARMKKIQSKKEAARVFTTLYINFSDMQGQITLKLVVVSGQNLNSSKLSCMSSLPARMRLIKSKMKELECSQDFSHYKYMGIFTDIQGQLTPQSLVRSGQISNSSEMLWMSSLPASMKKIRSQMKVLECSQDFPPL